MPVASQPRAVAARYRPLPDQPGLDVSVPVAAVAAGRAGTLQIRDQSRRPRPRGRPAPVPATGPPRRRARRRPSRAAVRGARAGSASSRAAGRRRGAPRRRVRSAVAARRPRASRARRCAAACRPRAAGPRSPRAACAHRARSRWRSAAAARRGAKGSGAGGASGSATTTRSPAVGAWPRGVSISGSLGRRQLGARAALEQRAGVHAVDERPLEQLGGEPVGRAGWRRQRGEARSAACSGCGAPRPSRRSSTDERPLVAVAQAEDVLDGAVREVQAQLAGQVERAGRRGNAAGGVSGVVQAVAVRTIAVLPGLAPEDRAQHEQARRVRRRAGRRRRRGPRRRGPSRRRSSAWLPRVVVPRGVGQAGQPERQQVCLGRVQIARGRVDAQRVADLGARHLLPRRDGERVPEQCGELGRAVAAPRRAVGRGGERGQHFARGAQRAAAPAARAPPAARAAARPRSGGRDWAGSPSPATSRRPSRWSRCAWCARGSRACGPSRDCAHRACPAARQAAPARARTRTRARRSGGERGPRRAVSAARRADASPALPMDQGAIDRVRRPRRHCTPCRPARPSRSRPSPTRVPGASTRSVSTAPSSPAVCPKTGQPDFATLRISYVPGETVRRAEVAQALPLELPRRGSLPRRT